jgi:hypothetical protein
VGQFNWALELFSQLSVNCSSNCPNIHPSVQKKDVPSPSRLKGKFFPLSFTDFAKEQPVSEIYVPAPIEVKGTFSPCHLKICKKVDLSLLLMRRFFNSNRC